MKHGAFTLVELLIVIAIIGILAAVLVPNLVSARAKANEAAAISLARNCYVAGEAARNMMTGALPFTDASVTCGHAALLGGLPAGITVANYLQNGGGAGVPLVGVLSVNGKEFIYDGRTLRQTN